MMNNIENTHQAQSVLTQANSQEQINQLLTKALSECQQALQNSNTLNQSVGSYFEHHNIKLEDNISDLVTDEDDSENQETRREVQVSKQLKQLQSQSWDNMSAGLLSKPMRAIISGTSMASMDTNVTMSSDHKMSPPSAPRLRC